MNSGFTKENLVSEPLRRGCRGTLPLDARLEPWMCMWLNSEAPLDAVQQYGSPLNVVCTEPMDRNVRELQSFARDRGLDFQIFFARKSNKCLSLVDRTVALAIGVDTASENELQQCLERGVQQADLICTAAIKNDSLIDLCIARGVCIAVDNHDELDAVVASAERLAKRATIAIRLGGFWHDGAKLVTRFGFDVDRDLEWVAELAKHPIDVAGIHFHLDGYAASERVSALTTSLRWIETLRASGHTPRFIDMGGGFPMSYLEHAHQWNQFWNQHERALLENRNAVTYRNHALGRHVVEGAVHGPPNCYPYYQRLTRSAWLASVLDHSLDGQTIAHQLRKAKVQLRCEPGRSLLDGCGLTIAQVEFRKRNAAGDWLIGISMNRTQCRTSSDDFLVDPILLPSSKDHRSPMAGYLVGAYCTESELLSVRRLEFPHGIERKDLIVFPNTAGYLMHFLESRSHQFPLAKNVVLSEDGLSLDPIDRT